MIELTIEEKAEAYDKALDRARIWKEMSGMPKDKQGILDNIFPELKESEDEKIRKTLINVFATHKDYEIFFGVSVKDILAWLEKQKAVDFFSVHSREEVSEIDKRIERKQKEYDAKLRDKIMKAKDFPMTD